MSDRIAIPLTKEQHTSLQQLGLQKEGRVYGALTRLITQAIDEYLVREVPQYGHQNTLAQNHPTAP